MTAGLSFKGRWDGASQTKPLAYPSPELANDCVIVHLPARLQERSKVGNHQAGKGTASASSSLNWGVAEFVRVRVFLKSHDFSYPQIKA